MLIKKKFNQMEVEMDKFLAKKHAIFKETKAKQAKAKDEKGLGFIIALSDSQMRYKMNSCIL